MLRRYLKIIISILFWIYLFILKNIRGRNNYHSVILSYHNITGDQRKRFAKQMDLILRYSRPVPADYIKKNNENRCVAVTFDDGYRGVIWNVIPEISKRNIPVTFFITLGSLGSKPGWCDHNISLLSEEAIINSNELRNISKNNLVTIGSHTISHSHLLSLPISEVRKEILHSKITLEKIINKKVDLFSFPYGEYNSEVVSICRQAGYKYVYSILPVSVDFNIKEYIKGRVIVEPSDRYLEFRLKLAGAYHWESKICTIKRFIKNIGK